MRITGVGQDLVPVSIKVGGRRRPAPNCVSPLPGSWAKTITHGIHTAIQKQLTDANPW